MLLSIAWMRRGMMIERPDQTAEKELVLNRLEEQNPLSCFRVSLGFLKWPGKILCELNTIFIPSIITLIGLKRLWVHRDFELREVLQQRKDLLDASGVLIAVLEMVRRGRLRMTIEGKRVDFVWQEVKEDLKTSMIS